MYKSTGSDGMHLKVLRELDDVIVRLSSVIFMTTNCGKQLICWRVGLPFRVS